MSQPTGDEPQSARRGLGGQHRPEPMTGPGRHRWPFLRQGAGIFVTAILLSLLVKTVFVQAFIIPSGSMEPVLHGCPGCFGDRVLVNKLSTRMGGVHRGDIVVFHDTAGWLPRSPATPGLQGRVREALAFIGLATSSSESDLVKRVIGIGGDTVEGREGRVYLNGIPLDEPYVFPGDSRSNGEFRVTVPGDRLWVMGDHRSDSGDSRFHRQGPGQGFVPVEDVVGRAWVIAWPLERVGSLDRPATFDQPMVTTVR